MTSQRYKCQAEERGQCLKRSKIFSTQVQSPFFKPRCVKSQVCLEDVGGWESDRSTSEINPHIHFAQTHLWIQPHGHRVQSLTLLHNSIKMDELVLLIPTQRSLCTKSASCRMLYKWVSGECVLKKGTTKKEMDGERRKWLFSKGTRPGNVLDGS